MAEPTSIVTTVVLAGTAGVGAAIGVSMFDSAALVMFGVPSIVILFSFLGSAGALAYSDPIRPWMRMAATMAVNTMMGIVASVSLPAIPFFHWIEHMPKQGVSFIVAFLALWFTPAITRTIGPALSTFISRWAGGNSGKKEQ